MSEFDGMFDAVNEAHRKVMSDDKFVTGRTEEGCKESIAEAKEVKIPSNPDPGTYYGALVKELGVEIAKKVADWAYKGNIKDGDSPEDSYYYVYQSTERDGAASDVSLGLDSFEEIHGRKPKNAAEVINQFTGVEECRGRKRGVNKVNEGKKLDPNDHTAAYIKGYKDGCKGALASENPYFKGKENREKAEDWEAGQARAEDEFYEDEEKKSDDGKKEEKK